MSQATFNAAAYAAEAEAEAATTNTASDTPAPTLPTSNELFPLIQNASNSAISSAILETSVVIENILTQGQLSLYNAASAFSPNPICRDHHESDMRALEERHNNLLTKARSDIQNAAHDVLRTVDLLEGLRKMLVNAKRVLKTQQNALHLQIRLLDQSNALNSAHFREQSLPKDREYTETIVQLMTSSTTHKIKLLEKMIKQNKQTYKSQSRQLSKQIRAQYDHIRTQVREFSFASQAMTGRVISHAADCRIAYERAVVLAMIEFCVQHEWRDLDVGMFPVAEMRGNQCWLLLFNHSSPKNCVFEQQISLSAPPCHAEARIAFQRAQDAALDAHLEIVLSQEKEADQTHQGFFSRGPADEDDERDIIAAAEMFMMPPSQPWCVMADSAETAAAAAAADASEEEDDEIFTGHTPKSVTSNASFAAALAKSSSSSARTANKQPKKKSQKRIVAAKKFKPTLIQPNTNRVESIDKQEVAIIENDDDNTHSGGAAEETTTTTIPNILDMSLQEFDILRKKHHKSYKSEHVKANPAKNIHARWIKQFGVDKTMSQMMLSVGCE